MHIYKEVLLSVFPLGTLTSCVTNYMYSQQSSAVKSWEVM